MDSEEGQGKGMAFRCTCFGAPAINENGVTPLSLVVKGRRFTAG